MKYPNVEINISHPEISKKIIIFEKGKKLFIGLMLKEEKEVIRRVDISSNLKGIICESCFYRNKINRIINKVKKLYNKDNLESIFYNLLNFIIENTKDKKYIFNEKDISLKHSNYTIKNLTLNNKKFRIIYLEDNIFLCKINSYNDIVDPKKIINITNIGYFIQKELKFYTLEYLINEIFSFNNEIIINKLLLNIEINEYDIYIKDKSILKGKFLIFNSKDYKFNNNNQIFFKDKYTAPQSLIIDKKLHKNIIEYQILNNYLDTLYSKINSNISLYLNVINKYYKKEKYCRESPKNFSEKCLLGKDLLNNPNYFKNKINIKKEILNYLNNIYIENDKIKYKILHKKIPIKDVGLFYCINDLNFYFLKVNIKENIIYPFLLGNVSLEGNICWNNNKPTLSSNYIINLDELFNKYLNSIFTIEHSCFPIIKKEISTNNYDQKIKNLIFDCKFLNTDLEYFDGKYFIEEDFKYILFKSFYEDIDYKNIRVINTIKNKYKLEKIIIKSYLNKYKIYKLYKN